MNEHGLGRLEQRPLVEQRAGQSIAQGASGAVLSLGNAGAEEASRAVGSQRAHQIVEADIDEAWAHHEADDRLD